MVVVPLLFCSAIPLSEIHLAGFEMQNNSKVNTDNSGDSEKVEFIKKYFKQIKISLVVIDRPCPFLVIPVYRENRRGLRSSPFSKVGALIF